METLYTVKLHEEDAWYEDRDLIEGRPLRKKGEYYYFNNKSDQQAARKAHVYAEFFFSNKSELSKIKS